LKKILWSVERVVAARSTKDTDRFRWRNAPFLVNQISIPPPDALAWFISDEYVAENNENDPSLRPDSDARVTANSDAKTTADSDYKPVAGMSNNLPKKYRTRNKGKKTNVWLDVIHSSQ
ncbi:11349_t:CDS:1, partial [Racocetra persica]